MKSTPEDEPRKTLLDRLIGSLKWGTIGTAAGALGGVGLGALARKGKFGREFKRYASRKFPLFPHPAVTHAIVGAGVGSKVGTVGGLIVGRKPKDVKELSALLDDLIEFGDFPLSTLKKVIRGMRQKGTNPELIRPAESHIGMGGTYVPPGHSPKLLRDAAREMGAPGYKLKPNSIIVPRALPEALRGHPAAAEWTPLRSFLHESGHSADPTIKAYSQGLVEKKAALDKLMKRKATPAAIAEGEKLGMDLAHGALNREVQANREVLDQFKKHGTADDVTKWKKTATSQMRKAYQGPWFEMVKPGTLSGAKQLVRNAPFLRKKAIQLSSNLASSSLVSMSLLDRMRHQGRHPSGAHRSPIQ
jgi:hypothetical protein